MASTSPDGLTTPDPGSPFQPVTDLAILATDTQSALIRRANLYVGTTAQRNAFTTAPEGTHWQDTNGEKHEYAWKSGRWTSVSPLKLQVSLTFSGTTGASAPVTFPVGMFTTPPSVMVTKQSASVARAIPYVASITTTGCTIGAFSGNNTNETGTVPMTVWVIP